MKKWIGVLVSLSLILAFSLPAYAQQKAKPMPMGKEEADKIGFHPNILTAIGNYFNIILNLYQIRERDENNKKAFDANAFFPFLILLCIIQFLSGNRNTFSQE